MSDNARFISDDMQAAIGRVVDWGQSFPVSASDIRRWLVAVHHPQPPPRLLWTQRDADLIAPAEFNPFAWLRSDAMIPATPFEPRDSERFERPLGLTGPGLLGELNGGLAARYDAPIRVGDVIRSETRLARYREREREGRLGPMLLTETEVTWTNQHRATVLSGRATSIRYDPARSVARARSANSSAAFTPASRTQSSRGSGQPARTGRALVALPPLAEATPRITLSSSPLTSGLEQWNRFAAVNDEFVPIHMDAEAGRKSGYPGAIGMGRLLWSYLHNLLRRWISGAGQILSADLQFRSALQADSRPACNATVTDVRDIGTNRRIQLAVEVVDCAGRILAPGRAALLTSSGSPGVAR